jgi:hypothetical protein
VHLLCSADRAKQHQHGNTRTEGILREARPAGPHVLELQYDEKDQLKNLGALWDSECPRGPGEGNGLGKWYVPVYGIDNIAQFAQWLPKEHFHSVFFNTPYQAKLRKVQRLKQGLPAEEAGARVPPSTLHTVRLPIETCYCLMSDAAVPGACAECSW